MIPFSGRDYLLSSLSFGLSIRPCCRARAAIAHAMMEFINNDLFGEANQHLERTLGNQEAYLAFVQTGR